MFAVAFGRIPSQVMTAVALVTPDGACRTRLAMTRVSVLRLEDSAIKAYVDSREGVGKAGGYAIQGRAEIFVKEISGLLFQCGGIAAGVEAAATAQRTRRPVPVIQ